MMDGRLEGKGDEEVWLDVPQPTFMTEVAAAAWYEGPALCHACHTGHGLMC